MRLDSLAASFVKENGLDLLKVDTEGYDFSALRSASTLLLQYKPTVYFGWFPATLKNLGEDVFSAFNPSITCPGLAAGTSFSSPARVSFIATFCPVATIPAWATLGHG